MRILHVITSLLTGGAERLMVDILPRLSAAGHEVELCVFNGTITPFYKELLKRGITIHNLMPDGGNVYNPRIIPKLRRIIRSGHFDIVHSHNTAAQLFAALCAPKGVIMVTTEHNTSNRRRDKWYLKPVDRWMYSKYKFVACISKAAKESLDSYLGISEKTELIENGIDLSIFSTIGNKKASDKRVITMVAAFRPQKDHETAINAMKYLSDDYIMRFVGDGVRRGEIEGLVSQAGMGDRIKFLGNRSDIPLLLKETDIVILSSHYEGLSLSSVEGMASGRPFIASDVPGLHEVVEGAGVLFPEGDSMALASQIMELCENRALYDSVAKACVERASKYDISITVDKYLKCYEKLYRERKA